jgi:hypothetical protein
MLYTGRRIPQKLLLPSRRSPFYPRARAKGEVRFALCIGLRRLFDGGFHFQFNTLSDWGQHAKHVDRSLRAYTPAPSNPSSLGALVQP